MATKRLALTEGMGMLAVATIGNADYLLTWNLKHRAGAVARRRPEQELRLLGHQPPTICTPEELRASYD